MKWTPDKLDMLRAMAEAGAYWREIGVALGCSYEAARLQARGRGFALWRFRYDGPKPSAPLNERWAKLIGPMKAELRADIERIMAS